MPNGSARRSGARALSWTIASFARLLALCESFPTLRRRAGDGGEGAGVGVEGMEEAVKMEGIERREEEEAVEAGGVEEEGEGEVVGRALPRGRRLHD